MKNGILIILIVLIPLSFLLFFGKALKHNFNTLPYYHPSDLFDTVEVNLGKDYHIPDFSFENYDGRVISNTNMDDDVYLILPFSFSSENFGWSIDKMNTVNFKYRDEKNIKIFGLNTDGVVQDSVALKEFDLGINKNFDNRENIYYLSTSSKEKMVTFISDGIGIKQVEMTPYGVLIDPNGQIRGRYNFRAESQVSDAIEDIALLRKEISDGKYSARKNSEGSN